VSAGPHSPIFARLPIPNGPGIYLAPAQLHRSACMYSWIEIFFLCSFFSVGSAFLSALSCMPHVAAAGAPPQASRPTRA